MSNISHVEIANALISKLEEARQIVNPGYARDIESEYGEVEKLTLMLQRAKMNRNTPDMKDFEPEPFNGKLFECSGSFAGTSDMYIIWGTKKSFGTRRAEINWRQFCTAVTLLPMEMQEELSKHFQYKFEAW